MRRPFSCSLKIIWIALLVLSRPGVVASSFQQTPSQNNQSDSSSHFSSDLPLARRQKKKFFISQQKRQTMVTVKKQSSSSGSRLAMAPPATAMAPLSNVLGVYVFSNILGFVISLVTKSHIHLDLIGTGAFAVAALPHIGSPVAFTKLSAMSIVLWSTKLSLFLFYRASIVKHDARLTETLDTVSGTFGFWLITFFWQLFVSLPFQMGLAASSRATEKMGTTSTALVTKIGFAIFLVGFLIESFADGQKFLFKQGNPGKFCNVGLWKYSQHPNFFGNLVLWAGIFIINIPSYTRPIHWGIALLSPMFLWSLLNGQAQGVVTNAVEMAKNKYGNDPEFQIYIEEVPKIIPMPKLF